MSKNIVILLLVVLLIISIGFGAYYFMSLQKTNKALGEAQGQITSLKAENDAMQNKMAKGVLYVGYLRPLFEPMWRDYGSEAQQNAAETALLSKITKIAEDTGDAELKTLDNEIQKGDENAGTALFKFMDRIVVLTANALK